MEDKVWSIEVDGIEGRRPRGVGAGEQFVREFLQLIDESNDYGSDITKSSYRYDPNRVYCDVCWLGKRHPEHDHSIHRSALRLMEAQRG